MELISQHTKQVMEECKVRAMDAGLSFDTNSLEYIVSNRDLIELSPKGMIPTLYDYWVNDVEVLKKKGVYKLYPTNPYETVINTRPAISFYNDNNPDWLNIMIFYHVLAHIDFFQNNILFEDTWRMNFVDKALASKRIIESYRSEYGRWVDYVIEFSRGINNLVGFFNKLSVRQFQTNLNPSKPVEFYFDVFLQDIKKAPEHVIFQEIEKYNQVMDQNENVGESIFFADVKRKYPEFDATYARYDEEKLRRKDIMQYILDHSSFLNKEPNRWMKSVMEIVRETALYFEPQIRTKTINEGWSSYWHDQLFRKDERIAGHESSFAKINAFVTSISRVGLNPYAIGLRLFEYIEKLADQGRLEYKFQKIRDIPTRENYDNQSGEGKKAIFKVRENFSDFMFVNTFVDQDFVDEYKLFVAGKRVNEQKGVYEYFVKSRKAEDYKKMLTDNMYHPPVIEINQEKTTEDNLYLEHQFEGKQLYKDFIPETLIGIEYLWGGPVQLRTTEIVKRKITRKDDKPDFKYREVLYAVKDRKVDKITL
jgi:stage V sporulation protein R